jgi:hypothetical protein
MLHAGLDLSRKHLDVCLLSKHGELVEESSAPRMREIWRAILRADLAVFDTSGGNPNVAFELGLAVAEDKRCSRLFRRLPVPMTCLWPCR